MYLSSNCAVASRAHNATESLHRINWSSDIEQCSSANAVEVVSFLLLFTIYIVQSLDEIILYDMKCGLAVQVLTSNNFLFLSYLIFTNVK